MDKLPAAIIVAVVLIVALLLMLRSWRRRTKRQGDLAQPLSVPENTGAQLASVEGLYLSTTPDGEPLNRIAVRGLGFRARFTVVVTEAGIVLPIPGDIDIFIPAADIREISTASWTIDRGIEPRGLTVVRWTLGDTKLDSYFRFDEPEQFSEPAKSLIHATTGSETQ